MPASTFTVEVPDEKERGVRVSCRVHGDTAEFRPGRQRGTFYCEGCGFELEVALYDLLDWRDWGERC